MTKIKLSKQRHCEIQREIIQGGINHICMYIDNVNRIINNHPEDDIEFIEMQKRHLKRYEELISFALDWKQSIK